MYFGTIWPRCSEMQHTTPYRKQELKRAADRVAPSCLANRSLSCVFLRASPDGYVEGVHGGHNTKGRASSRSPRQELVISGRYGVGKVDKYLDVIGGAFDLQFQGSLRGEAIAAVTPRSPCFAVVLPHCCGAWCLIYLWFVQQRAEGLMIFWDNDNNSCSCCMSHAAPVPALLPYILR